MLGTVMMHSFITVTVFEQLISPLKANEMFNFFRLMLQKKRQHNKNGPRTLKRKTRQEKMPHLYQEKVRFSVNHDQSMSSYDS